MQAFEFFEKGGIVMWPLLAFSVYALAVVFYKVFQFYTAGIFSTAFIDPTMQYVKKGELTAAEHILERCHGPIARIMRVAIVCVANRNMSIKSREAEIARVGTSELRSLETHMRGLEMVANTSPLLGLLGTVTGMVDAFSRLGQAGNRVDPAMLANGIWEALITTAGGLFIAIPAVAAYYILDSVIERVRATMKDVTVQILALEDEYIRNEKEQERREMLARERMLRDLQEAQERAMEQARTTPQSSSTLRLLSPSYTQF